MAEADGLKGATDRLRQAQDQLPLLLGKAYQEHRALAKRYDRLVLEIIELVDYCEALLPDQPEPALVPVGRRPGCFEATPASAPPSSPQRSILGRVFAAVRIQAASLLGIAQRARERSRAFQLHRRPTPLNAPLVPASSTLDPPEASAVPSVRQKLLTTLQRSCGVEPWVPQPGDSAEQGVDVLALEVCTALPAGVVARTVFPGYRRQNGGIFRRPRVTVCADLSSSATAPTDASEPSCDHDSPALEAPHG
jgi:hypothetical protein